MWGDVCDLLLLLLLQDLCSIDATGDVRPIVSSGEAEGVVDSLCYNSNLDIWCGCCKNRVLLFRRKSILGLTMIHHFKTVDPIDPAQADKERLISCRFSNSGEYIVCGGEGSIVSVYELTQIRGQDGRRRGGEGNSTTDGASVSSSPNFAGSTPGSSSSLYTSTPTESTASSSPAATRAAAGSVLFREEKWKETLVSKLIGHTGDIKDCCISCDNNLVASCATDGQLRIWDWKLQKLLHVIRRANQQQQPQQQRPTTQPFRCCRFLPSPPGVVETEVGMQRLFAVASSSPRGASYLVGWSVTYNSSGLGEETSPTTVDKKDDDANIQQEGADSAAADPAAADPAAAAPVSDAGDAAVDASGAAPAAPGAAADPDAVNAATAAKIRVRQLCEMKCGDSVPCSKAAVNGDGSLLALGFADGQCKVYDRALRVIAQHQRHELPVTGLAFAKDYLVSTSADYSIVVSNLAKRKASRSCCGWRRILCSLLLVLLLGGIFLHYCAIVGYNRFIEMREAVAVGAMRDTLVHYRAEKHLQEQLAELQRQNDELQQQEVEGRGDEQQHQEKRRQWEQQLADIQRQQDQLRQQATTEEEQQEKERQWKTREDQQPEERQQKKKQQQRQQTPQRQEKQQIQQMPEQEKHQTSHTPQQQQMQEKEDFQQTPQQQQKQERISQSRQQQKQQQIPQMPQQHQEEEIPQTRQQQQKQHEQIEQTRQQQQQISQMRQKQQQEQISQTQQQQQQEQITQTRQQQQKQETSHTQQQQQISQTRQQQQEHQIQETRQTQEKHEEEIRQRQQHQQQRSQTRQQQEKQEEVPQRQQQEQKQQQQQIPQTWQQQQQQEKEELDLDGHPEDITATTRESNKEDHSPLQYPSDQWPFEHDEL